MLPVETKLCCIFVQCLQLDFTSQVFEELVKYTKDANIGFALKTIGVHQTVPKDIPAAALVTGLLTNLNSFHHVPIQFSCLVTI